jgi:transposase-like protein
MEICEDVGELARELGVRPRCLYKWRRKLEMVEPGQESSRPSTNASAHRKEIHRLKQLLAEKTLQSVIGTLLLEVVASQPPQVVVNQRQNRLERLAISMSPLEEQLVDWHGGLGHFLASWVDTSAARILKATQNSTSLSVPGFAVYSTQNRQLVGSLSLSGVCQKIRP